MVISWGHACKCNDTSVLPKKKTKYNVDITSFQRSEIPITVNVFTFFFFFAIDAYSLAIQMSEINNNRGLLQFLLIPAFADPLLYSSAESLNILICMAPCAAARISHPYRYHLYLKCTELNFSSPPQRRCQREWL